MRQAGLWVAEPGIFDFEVYGVPRQMPGPDIFARVYPDFARYVFQDAHLFGVPITEPVPGYFFGFLGVQLNAAPALHPVTNNFCLSDV